LHLRRKNSSEWIGGVRDEWKVKACRSFGLYEFNNSVLLLRKRKKSTRYTTTLLGTSQNGL
jgi:hypothetical protein